MDNMPIFADHTLLLKIFVKPFHIVKKNFQQGGLP